MSQDPRSDREARFDQTYRPGRVILRDWLVAHHVRRAPVEKSCWAVPRYPKGAPTLLCVRRVGRGMRLREVATIYVAERGSLRNVWQAVVGAHENWLKLWPKPFGHFFELIEWPKGQCQNAVSEAVAKADAGVHDRAFVDLLRSACARLGKYEWRGDRVSRIPADPEAGTLAPCRVPPPPLVEPHDVPITDDVRALREVDDTNGVAERRYVELRLRTPLDAFQRHDTGAIRRWIEDSRTRQEERTFGAYVLHLLDDPEGGTTFINHFPDRDAAAFGRLLDLAEALYNQATDAERDACPQRRPECFEPQPILACAAVAGWKDAARKLILAEDLTDAGSAVENHTLLTEATESRPLEMVTLATHLCKPERLVHAFISESRPDSAARVLRALRGKKHADADVEAVRSALVPILRWKAGADRSDQQGLRCDVRL